MNINRVAFKKLLDLKSKDKFIEDINLHYPGSTDEKKVFDMNKLLNKSIDEIIYTLEDNPIKKIILENVQLGLSRFEALNLDTEDRERVCSYYDEIMAIIGIDRTNGLLNEWLYGFSPNQ